MKTHLVLLGACILLSSLAARGAEEASAPVPTGAAAPVPAAASSQPVEAPTPVYVKGSIKKKPGALRRAIKGIEAEVADTGSSMAKDLAFVFSVQDFDPYEEKPPKDEPYVLSTIEYIDGSEADVVKYPDGMLKIKGGFADGTVMTPNKDGSLTVAYPNGAVGKMEKNGTAGFKIVRPDNTITFINKTDSGDYSIKNDKLGFMGTAVLTDHTGLNYRIRRASAASL